MTNQEMYDVLMEKLSNLNHIKTDEIPNIDLYMDQVTTFMDEHLQNVKRYDEDKILTKTMINNYAKNNLLPPPIKKKYTKDHMLLLIFIYYFKNFLSINDIKTILSPLTNKYFSSESSPNLEDIYSEVFSFEKNGMEKLKKDIERKFIDSTQSFAQTPEDEKDYLQLFSFICMLGFDIYLKKQMLESIIDELKTNGEPKSKK